MPQRDIIHNTVKQAIINDGWEITEDPYIISYGERFLFVDLGAVEADSHNRREGYFFGAQREGQRIAVEIKDFRGKSAIADLELAIGQYVLYRLLLNKVDPERKIYLAITDVVYDDIFREPIGELVIYDLPLNLLVIDLQKIEVLQWIPPRHIEKS